MDTALCSVFKLVQSAKFHGLAAKYGGCLSDAIKVVLKSSDDFFVSLSSSSNSYGNLGEKMPKIGGVNLSAKELSSILS